MYVSKTFARATKSVIMCRIPIQWAQNSIYPNGKHFPQFTNKFLKIEEVEYLINYAFQFFPVDERVKNWNFLD